MDFNLYLFIQEVYIFRFLFVSSAHARGVWFRADKEI